MPAVPRIVDPVGKSGPRTCSISPSVVIAGSAMNARQAAMHFAEIVRRDVGRHADRDSAGAVDQQIGEARGQDLRLALRRVVIGREVDRVLVGVAEQEIGDLGEPRFGVAHRRGRIGVHRAEIALAVDQRHAHRPALRHPGERVVDRAVAVRVIFTHDVADDAARLAVGAAGDIAGFLAGVEDAAVDRLQAVADVGQRAADDDRHRVIEVAGLHLLDDGDGGNVAVGFVDRRRGGQGVSCSLGVVT